MPGPTPVGRYGPTVRGVLTALVATALVAALGVTVAVVRRGPDLKAATPAPVSAEQATQRLLPKPGATGSATCTDPSARQEWRVTWVAAPASAVSRSAATAPADAPTATPSPTAPTIPPLSTDVPTTPPAPPTPTLSTDVPITSTPAPDRPLPSAAGPPSTASPSTTTELLARLAVQTSAVTLIPTGFAVRPIPGAAPAPSTTLVPESATPSGLSTPSPTPTLPGGWQSRDLDRWLLRWTPTAAELRSANLNEEWVRMGPLATLALLPRSAHQSPRFVTPDGACTVYLAPFLSGPAGVGAADNTVAVVGDSLVVQLAAAETGQRTGPGILLSRLATAGERPEIAGQGGRRFSVKPDGLSGLEQADATMLDELRGLREARSVVVALGTNDAGWVALAPTPELYELRLSWVMTHLAPIVDELRDHGNCTVLTTIAVRNKRYNKSHRGRFDAVAVRINDYLRMRAEADPNDGLKLWDWGARADAHGTRDPLPWFGRDTIHLNRLGLAPYADNLTSASALC